MLRGRSNFGLAYICVSLVFTIYLSYEMNDGNFLTNFFSTVTLSPLLYGMFFNIATAITAYVSNSRFLFVMAAIGLIFNALLYVIEFWFVFLLLLGLCVFAIREIKELNRVSREARDYFIVNGYLKEQNIEVLDEQLVKRLARDYRGE